MIGIIGFGRFGALMTHYLSKDFEVLVSTRSDKKKEVEESGATSVPFKDACAQRIVILCVPISHMREVLKKVSDFLVPDAIVLDVCSVKTLPCLWMKELLPDSVDIFPTHPLFGPDSAAFSLKKKKIVICKDRIKPHRYKNIKAYLEELGLIVIESTPEKHDEEIAISLSLTHFIGRTLSRFPIKKQDIDTQGYRHLLHITQVVENDTWQLFEDMKIYNPFAKDKWDRFIEAAQDLIEEVEAKGDR